MRSARGGHDPEAGIGQRLFDLGVLRVGGVQVLQHLTRGVVVAVGTQRQRPGQPAVYRGDGDRAVRLLEVGQRRSKHPQPRQRDPERDLDGVREMLVEGGVVDDRRQQLDDVSPPLGAVVDGRRDPAGLPGARPPLADFADQFVGLSKSPVGRQRRGVGEVEVVGLGRAEPQVQPGVVVEPQGARRQFHLALQHSRSRRVMRNRFQHRGGRVTGGSQPDPGVALVVGDSDQAGEPGAGSGQVGRTLAVVDGQPERAATSRESARYVVVHPDRCRAGWRRCRSQRFPRLVSPSDVVLPKLTSGEVSIAQAKCRDARIGLTHGFGHGRHQSPTVAGQSA